MDKKVLLGLALTLFILVFIPLYWATEPGRQAAARERQKVAAVERGAYVYASVCAGCHGETGEGLIGPPLKDTPLDEEILRRIISNGVAKTAMPAFAEEEGGDLKTHQVTDVITFLKNWDSVLLAKIIAEVTVPPPPTTSGEQLFSTNCVACHGANRQGGLGPALTPESLAAKSDEEIRTTITSGRIATPVPMPAWGGTLNDEQIEALLQFIKYTPAQ